MSAVDGKELWRQIPPEEKFALMARAHASGISAALIAIGLGSTLAVAFQVPWLMWGSMIVSPVMFQFAAGKAWRGLRPRIMLEYLAARSAARRYAYTANAKDLSVSLIFRGKMEQVFNKEEIMEELAAAVENAKEAEVWITLFKDAVVLMSEKPGGAKCELAHVLNEKVKVESRSSDGEDYSSSKEVYITITDRSQETRKVKLTSSSPAAMIVFEKTIQSQLAAARPDKGKESSGMQMLDSAFD